MSEIDLELLSHELIEAEKKAMQKRLQYFDDAFTKLKRGNKEAIDAMRTIEKSFVEELKQEKASFDSLKQNINTVESELKVGLDNYFASYNVDTETKKLEDSKEKGVMPKMMIYRKETHDANFKYDRILKEEKDTLRDKQDAFEEFEKQSKSKLFDLEKRCRLEVNKEKNQTIASYDDLQRKLLDTNNRKEIKDINKNIQEMQKVGLKNEKAIKLNYQDLIKTEKLNYEENKKNLLIDINNTTKDYALKKLEIETEKKYINQRFQIELDKYDFGSKRAINNLNQKMLLKKNSLVLSYKKKINDIANNAKAEKLEKIDYKENVTKDFVSVIGSNYKAFNDTNILGAKLIKDAYVLENDKYNVYLNNILENVKNMIISLTSEYFENVVKTEYENIKLIVNAKYNYETLNGKSYDSFIEKINKLYESFKENVTRNMAKHIEEINKLIGDAKEYINGLIENVKVIIKSDNEEEDFNQKLYEILNEEVENTSLFEKEAYEKERNSFEYIDANIKAYQDSLEDAEKENNEISLKHSEEDEKIDEEANLYYAKKEEEKAKINEEYLNEVKKIEDECASKNKELEDIALANFEQIKTDKINNCKQIELDYTTAMNLLK